MHVHEHCAPTHIPEGEMMYPFRLYCQQQIEEECNFWLAILRSSCTLPGCITTSKKYPKLFYFARCLVGCLSVSRKNQLIWQPSFLTSFF